MTNSTGYGRSSRILVWIAFMVLAVLPANGVAVAGGLKIPQLAVNLPEKYNTPDGMALGPNGDIYLSVSNVGNGEFPASIVKIDKDDAVSFVSNLPVHPVTNKVAPLGLAFGSDGHLYVADCQGFVGGNLAGRLLRVRMEKGRGAKVETVVEGMIFPNGVAGHGDSIYVTETTLHSTPRTPAASCVYRFPISELKGNEPVKIIPEGSDPHLYATIFAQNGALPFGADGIAFDAQGNMYVTNFGDATLHRFAVNKDGSIASHSILTGGSGMVSCDGMRIDPRNGDIYVADFLGNAIFKVDPGTGQATMIAKNEHGDGSSGKLDGCTEILVRGNRLYISNMDVNFGPVKHDKLHTISVITLD